MKKALMTSLNPENKSLYVRRIYNNKKKDVKTQGYNRNEHFEQNQN